MRLEELIYEYGIDVRRLEGKGVDSGELDVLIKGGDT